MSIHGYPTGPLGPGPSKERPPPGKPAIVHSQRPMPEAPAAPHDADMMDVRSMPKQPAPSAVPQSRGAMGGGMGGGGGGGGGMGGGGGGGMGGIMGGGGGGRMGLRETEIPGIYVGYTRNPKSGV